MTKSKPNIKKNKGKCSHCKMDLKKRNPSGFCNHLYYPEHCPICFDFLAPPGKHDPKLTVSLSSYSDFKLNAYDYAGWWKIIFNLNLGRFNLKLTRREK